MSRVNCAPGGGQGKVLFCFVLFFQTTISWLPRDGETFQSWLWNKWFKGTWGPISSPFQKVQRSFEKGFCSHCASVSNSFAGNSRHPYHLTVKTADPSEQRLPTSELHLMFLLISSDQFSWVTQTFVIHTLKMKGRGSLKEFDETRNRGWNAILKSFSLG